MLLDEIYPLFLKHLEFSIVKICNWLKFDVIKYSHIIHCDTLSVKYQYKTIYFNVLPWTQGLS